MLKPRLTALLLVALASATTLAQDEWKTAAGHPAEGGLSDFLGDAAIKMTPMFKNERFPNVVVTTDGTVLASYGSSKVRVRRSEDGGKTLSLIHI